MSPAFEIGHMLTNYILAFYTINLVKICQALYQ